jgi:hypothetical protein
MAALTHFTSDAFPRSSPHTSRAPVRRVANEFCVDLHAAALRGVRQAGVVGDRATVSNADGLVAAVVLGSGCAFAGTPTRRTRRRRLRLPDRVVLSVIGDRER